MELIIQHFAFQYDTVVRFLLTHNFEFCIGLWKHAIEIGQRANDRITGDLQSMAALFGEMVHRRAFEIRMCTRSV